MRFLTPMKQEAEVNLSVYYTNREPAGPYKLIIKARSVRNLRFNDLVDPVLVPLDTDYAVLVQSNIPVVVQFTRMDTGQPELAGITSMAFPVDN